MKIKNLENAFDERIKEIDSQLYMNLIDNVTYEVERNYAETAFNHLKKEGKERVWERFFGKFDVGEYEQDKGVYNSVISFIREGRKYLQDFAEKEGFSEADFFPGK